MLKKIKLIIKRVFQILLYLIEVLGISMIITNISNKYIPCENWFEWIERITIIYALYEMIIIGILTQLNDVRKDEYLAITSFYKYLLEYTENNKEEIKNFLIKNAEKQLESDMLNDNDVRKDYDSILNNLKNNKIINANTCKIKIIYYEHSQEQALLNWKYSLLLRIFK